VEDGNAWIVQRRETYNDLLLREVADPVLVSFASSKAT
jgi:hypothetical protein